MKKLTIVLIGMTILLAMTASELLAKKVLVVQSYHKEYSWCEGIDTSISDLMTKSNIDVKTFYMDTKRKPSKEWKEQSGKLAEEAMKNYKPDVVITVDDNAQAFFAKNYVGDGKHQFVFSGVNADKEKYGFPAANITGILERTYADQSLELLKQIMPKTKKIVFISDASSTASLVLPRIKKMAKDGKLPVEIAAYEQLSTIAEWRSTIQKYNKDGSVDAFLIPLYHTVKKADGSGTKLPADVMKWTVENVNKPVVGLWPFSTNDGALCAVVVDPKEHGSVAARMAKEVIDGKTAGNIPVVSNKQGYVIVNVKSAQKLGVEVPYDILESTHKVID